jgi:hypothetical protein
LAAGGAAPQAARMSAMIVSREQGNRKRSSRGWRAIREVSSLKTDSVRTS